MGTKWKKPKVLSGKMYKVLTGEHEGQIGEQFAVRIIDGQVSLMLWFQAERGVQHYEEHEVLFVR